MCVTQADHQISTPASLLATIKLHKDKVGGVNVKSLRESWNGAQQALDELIKSGDVLPMRVGKEGKYKQVFWNEVRLDRGGKQVDQGQSSAHEGRVQAVVRVGRVADCVFFSLRFAEFRDAWHALRVPADIERALDESESFATSRDPAYARALPNRR